MFKQKEGSTTIVLLMFASVLVPLFVYIVAEIGQFQYVKEKLTFTTQQAVRSAVWQVDEELLADGKIVLNEADATAKIEEVLNRTIDGISHELVSEPNVKIDISTTGDEKKMELIGGREIQTDKAYVKVNMDYVVAGFLTEHFFAGTIEEMYEVDFSKEEIQLTVVNSGETDVIQWTSIVNPYRGYEKLTFPFSTTTADIRLLGGTNNHIQINAPIHSGTYEVSFDNGVSTVLSGVIGDTGGFEFKIPKKIPAGTQAFLKLTLFAEREVTTEVPVTEAAVTEEVAETTETAETADSTELTEPTEPKVTTETITTKAIVPFPTIYDSPLVIGVVEKDIGEVLMNRDTKMKEGVH